ncbi:hypothetical protein V1506DRAFT_550119 [Lipomyces tetrasporus]
MMLRTSPSKGIPLYPRWDVVERVHVTVKRLVTARSLLIVAYMGHAIIDTDSNTL